jgi:hypothetical protein
MRTLFAAVMILAGLALLLSGAYLGLVYFIGYDGVWTAELLWILVPAAIGLGLAFVGIRAFRAPARSPN